MIKLFFGFFAFMALLFLLILMLGAGVVLGFLGRLFGRSRSAADDALVLQNLASLTAGERVILADSVARNDRTVAVLSDQESIDSLVARQIVVQRVGDMGLVHYDISEAAWNVLRRSRIL